MFVDEYGFRTHIELWKYKIGAFEKGWEVIKSKLAYREIRRMRPVGRKLDVMIMHPNGHHRVRILRKRGGQQRAVGVLEDPVLARDDLPRGAKRDGHDERRPVQIPAHEIWIFLGVRVRAVLGDTPVIVLSLGQE